MANSDGLNIQGVQKQWEESQVLLNELRIRLESLATASDSAQRSSESIKAAEVGITGIATDLGKLVNDFSSSISVASESLSAMVQLSTQTDLVKLIEALDRVSSGQEQIKLDLESIKSDVAGQAQAIDSLQESQAQSLETREKLTKRLRAAVSSLPSRHQGKFAGLLNDD